MIRKVGMEEKREIGQGAKLALELGPVLLFFVAYIMVRDRTFSVGGAEYSGFVAVTAGFIPVLLVCSAVLWRLTGKLSRMQVVTAVLVVVFGGLSIWFNDERFFKIKPTIIYLLFAGILAVGLFRGKSAIQYVLAEALPLDERGWTVLTRNCAILFAALAVANEVIWRNFSTDVWVYFKTFGIPGVMFVFLFSQTAILMARQEQQATDGKADGKRPESGD